MNRFLSKSAASSPQGLHADTRAFETVGSIVDSPSLTVGRCRARRIREGIPGTLLRTSGIGTTIILAGESIRLLTGIDWVRVHLQSGPPVSPI